MTAPVIRTAEAVDTIIKAMTPFTGEFMARSATQAHCKNLGMVGDHVSREQLEKLLDKLGSALNVFLGREKSALVIADLRRALQSRGIQS
jgi:hypothetical protein